MKSLEEVDQAIQQAASDYHKWDFMDQLAYLRCLTLFAKCCDAINRKYDGREARMRSLLKKLGSEE